MNLNVGVNLAKQMNKLAKHKKVPYYTYRYNDDENCVYTAVNKSDCCKEHKHILPGKSEYYVYAAAGLLGAIAAVGYAVSKANRKKHLFW
ncbi:hypothetical protein [Clostridium thermarum]|uniref:hypothetical protein n=1 Tax=Clostridium thermarum TaxID=1716543 RepID=UPI0011237CD6|nr:hypothetical protein [Clostridium thermarum]